MRRCAAFIPGVKDDAKARRAAIIKRRVDQSTGPNPRIGLSYSDATTALALECIEPSGCATGEPECTSRGNEGMNISLSMVQMRAWVSIERVVSPPEGSVRQTWTTRSSNPPWGSVSQTLPTQPLREVPRQLPRKWRTHHVNMSRDKFVRQTQAQPVCKCDTRQPA